VTIIVKSFISDILSLLLFSFLLLTAGFLLFHLAKSSEYQSPFTLLTTSFLIIIAVSIAVFNKGLSKNPESHTFHTFIAIGLKFLLEMILALIWFVVLKKTEVQSVFMFFILYLAFSLFLIIFMLKTLKNRAL